MKTNVPITLDQGALIRIADVIDGKQTKRPATRKEIVALCQGHINALASAPQPLQRRADGMSSARCPYCESVQHFHAEGKAVLSIDCSACGETFTAAKRGDIA